MVTREGGVKEGAVEVAEVEKATSTPLRKPLEWNLR